MTPGTLYAIDGHDGWIYYGQVSVEGLIGFFRRRDPALAAPAEILGSDIMSVVWVESPSIGHALRNGNWLELGRFALVASLQTPVPVVQWPVGTLTVTVHQGGATSCTTRVEDPVIQDFELWAFWDAEYHIPNRLKTDFGDDVQLMAGGPIRRERMLKEQRAAKHPEPWHQLPDDWVPTSVR